MTFVYPRIHLFYVLGGLTQVEVLLKYDINIILFDFCLELAQVCQVI